MTAPTVDVDQLRRQFPQQVVQYFDAVVQAKFAEVDWRLAAIEEHLTTIEWEIDTAANRAAAAAEVEFERRALADIVQQLMPEIDAYIAEWVVDENTWERYRFYIDTQENIEALIDREDNTIYVWKETVSS